MKVNKAVMDFFNFPCAKGRPPVWVATVCKGAPHVVPVCFVKPLGDDRLLIANVFISKTVKNLKENPHVAVGASKKDEGFDGYLLKGAAEIIEEGPVFEEFRRNVEELSGGKRKPRSAILVRIEEVYSLQPRLGKKKLH
ncbi:pyridoxamine 5'-phosphate oxidase family protein [Candidatus Hecatella orcuttiae]|uniref:pyridoxamine 5'-phosphate oxidase family protein n=1 Tax=Candidatus Hecatella orcuttiae TaxID=1935119 RepID=UPI002867F6C8|nr:pyridoxamine 5'-phosphate oxidase family protein [Candidatus Hecatella orcuttiae]